MQLLLCHSVHVESFAKSAMHGGTNQFSTINCPSPVIRHGDENVLGGMAVSEFKLALVQNGVLLVVVVQLINLDNCWQNRDGTKIASVQMLSVVWLKR